MGRIRLLALLAGSVLLWPSVVSAQNGGLKFTLTDLGTFGGFQSEAFAINNKGQIVGDYLWTFKRLSGQGCFSKPAGQVAVVFGSSTCTARAVNASGAVAGWMSVGSATHAFRFDSSGNLYDLPPTNSFQYSYGYGIDNSGRVVGKDEVYGAEWDVGGHATLLNCFGGWYEGAVSATNSTGNIVAGECWGSPSWWFNGTKYDLATLGTGCWGYGDGQAFAINEGGFLVGYSASDDCVTHAVLWTPAIVDLAANAHAYAISNDNWIVGGLSGAGGFLRVSDSNCPQVVSLTTLLDSSGAGWSVTQAYGINDSHQIVGQGLAPNGQFHAILLTQANKLPLCKPV